MTEQTSLTTETDAELATPAIDALDDRDRRFVEARAAGLNGVEAAKVAGCDAPTRSGLATFAKRATRRTAAALEEMIAATAIDESSLVECAIKGLREIVKNPTNYSAAVRAAEVILKAAGRLVTRHEHAHLHASIDLPVLTPEESFTEWIQQTRMRLFTLSPEERERFRREIDIPDVSGMVPHDMVLDVAGEVV